MISLAKLSYHMLLT
jgi:hypothetical protein